MNSVGAVLLWGFLVWVALFVILALVLMLAGQAVDAIW